MDTYSTLKNEILNINRDISLLFSTVKSIPGMADYSFGEWEKACETPSPTTCARHNPSGDCRTD